MPPLKTLPPTLPPTSYGPVDVAFFGCDHWSMLVNAQQCCVDGKNGLGTLVHWLLRAHPTRHPAQAHVTYWSAAKGTRLLGCVDLPGQGDLTASLASGLRLADHDDWDCLDDLEAAGLVKIHSYVHGTVKMTERGQQVVSNLLTHKASGGSLSNFGLPAESRAAARREREIST